MRKANTRSDQGECHKSGVTSSERRYDVCIEMDSLCNEKGSRYVCEKQTLDLTKGSDILKRGSRYVCEKQTLDL
ncbi:hypothetical protein N8Z33_03385, partial [Flavobacteriaceae bacterium]|nr:hypothetical protein [Flavobacteriaceae bacterium]